MKLLSIRLHDYRGTVDREIEFAPSGVTVVEGPNEIGKSCIAEALDLLLDEMDSSTKRGVLAAKPVDRDAGPEVEALFETGPYRLRFRKRFVRRPVTELEVLAPRHENLTGRDAHERVRAILNETLDDGLWRALRIQQGGELVQPELAAATSLSAALDRAAGAVPAAREELALYDRVREEYQQYWTETGRPKLDRNALDKAVQEATTELASIENELRALERDIERSAAIDVDLRALGPKLAEQERVVAARVVEVSRVEQMTLRVQTLMAEAGAASARSESAARTVSERHDLVARVAAQAAQLQVAKVALGDSDPDVTAARDRNDIDLATVTQTRLEREAADALARLRRSDVSFLRNQLEAADLKKRRGAIQAAREAIASLQAELDKIRIDDASLSKLRAADMKLRTAQAVMGAAAPAIRLDAVVDTTVDIDGQTVALKAGMTVEKSVPSEARVTVPGLVEITVIPGTANPQLTSQLKTAEREFADLCAATGVANVADGELAVGSQRLLEIKRAEQGQAMAVALGSLTQENLEQRLAETTAQMDGYVEARPKSPAIPSDIKEAETASSAAEEELAQATLRVKEAEANEGASRKRFASLESEANQLTANLRVAEETLKALETSLAQARSLAPDDSIATAQVAAMQAAQVASQAASESQKELDLANPRETKALLDNSQQVLEGMRKDQRAAQDERIEINARLGERGEAGLAERRDRAMLARDAAADALKAYDRRAAARKLLYETLRAARDRVRAAYVGPLQTRVDELGKIVFGPTFQVCIDEGLSITSRTLQGKTIPLQSLSAGTREQLAVILRLACATIVASDGGVPVILDDVLGYSDPRRLEAMGAVLSEAGRTSQVIVFTCYPDRYRQVGGAHVLRLD
jgi:hypothetical protein